MILFKLLVFTFTLYEFIVDLDARMNCPKGQKVTKSEISCEDCPDEAFQDEENDSQNCRACTKCDPDSGSVIKEKCTKVTDTKCQCRGGFVPWESDSSTCKCDIGFGREGTECSKCEDGYFSKKINSRCQKWKGCKCGVQKNGTRSTDVICNTELQGCSDASKTYTTTQSNTYIATTTTSNKRLTSHHSDERAHTQRMPTITTTTTAASGHTDTYIGTGMVFLIFGIIGLLVLTAVICKLHITPQPLLPLKNDSLCRRPVEESGESSLSSLKLNPGEN